VALKRLGGIKGDQLTSAHQTFEQQTGEPQVQINFNQAGGEKFAKLTTENVGKPFAIVLTARCSPPPTSTPRSWAAPP
jgi:preprotein translocase subunit SecD